MVRADIVQARVVIIKATVIKAGMHDEGFSERVMIRFIGEFGCQRSAAGDRIVQIQQFVHIGRRFNLLKIYIFQKCNSWI